MENKKKTQQRGYNMIALSHVKSLFAGHPHQLEGREELAALADGESPKIQLTVINCDIVAAFVEFAPSGHFPGGRWTGTVEWQDNKVIRGAYENPAILSWIVPKTETTIRFNVSHINALYYINTWRGRRRRREPDELLCNRRGRGRATIRIGSVGVEARIVRPPGSIVNGCFIGPMPDIYLM